MPANPIDWSKFSGADWDNVRNDAKKPVADVLANLKRGGIEIRYGDLVLLAEERMLNECREYVRQKSPEERQHMMRSVDRALRTSVKKVMKGTASKKRMDNCHADLLLWTALREVAQS